VWIALNAHSNICWEFLLESFSCGIRSTTGRSTWRRHLNPTRRLDRRRLRRAMVCPADGAGRCFDIARRSGALRRWPHGTFHAVQPCEAEDVDETG
jgi:hypothetical protein